MAPKISFLVSVSAMLVSPPSLPAFAFIRPSINQYHQLLSRSSSESAIRLKQMDSQTESFDASIQEHPPSEQSTQRKHKHTLAILTMPHSTSARIANEAILERAIAVTTNKLSVVLRTNTGGTDSPTGEGNSNVSLTRLRRYAGEIYSMSWDAALGLDGSQNSLSEKKDGYESTIAGPIAKGGKLLDLIVYPQNLPNTPPEGWIANRPDLSCICSHDSITGWVTADSYASGSGKRYASRKGQGFGGLAAHVNAVNAEREVKGLDPLEALHVDDWPDGADVTGDENVIFLEDEDSSAGNFLLQNTNGGGIGTSSLIGGSPVPPSSLYSSVAVGGTFDGMHYGHRKLLTLAISSVQPISGRLLIGVTRDEMLRRKAFADRIPSLDVRIAGVLDFVGNLAPGMKNRIRCLPISDEYGPPGQVLNSDVYQGVTNDFDALVLSHETLPTGRKLNSYRESVLGLKPLKLLCTQRTEPHGMSSTALRRMRSCNS